ncbi:MAG: hypothetical protein AB1774_03620 [Bacillota bacterium]
MSPFNIGDELIELRSRTLRTPRRRGLPGIGFAVLVVVAAAAVGFAVFGAVGRPGPRGPRPPARTLVPEKTAASLKWRELQMPLPVAARSVRQEQAISFSMKGDADPFAPDVSAVRRYAGQLEMEHLRYDRRGPDEVSRILAAAASASQPPSMPALARVEPLPAVPLPEGEPPALAGQAPPPDRAGVPVVTIARLAPHDKQEGVAPGVEASGVVSGVVRAGEVKGEVTAGDISRVQGTGAASGGSSDLQSSGGATGQGPVADGGSKETSDSQGSPPPPQHKSPDERDGIDEKDKKTQEAADPGEAGKPSQQNAGAQVVAKPAQQATGAGAAGGAPQQPSAPGTTGKSPQQPSASGATGKPPQSPTSPEVSGKPVSPVQQKSPADEKAVKTPPAEMPKPEVQKPLVTPPLLLLTGVISSGDLAYAIVRTPAGSSIVRQGDEIDGMMVKSIQGKTITVIKQGEEFVIELGGGGKR